MRKKRLLIYNDRATGGGAENVMLTVADYLADNGYSVTVTTDETKPEEFKKVYSSKVKYYPRSLPYRFYKKYSLRWFVQGVIRHFYEDVIVWLLDHRKYDAAIAFKDGPCAIMVSELRAKKLISWVHTDYSSFHWTKACFDSDEDEFQCLKRFQNVICVSNAGKQAVIDTFGSVNEEELAALDQQIAQKTAVMQEGEKLLEQIGQFNRLHGQYTAERNETAVQHIECSRELEKCRSELESAQQYCEAESISICKTGGLLYLLLKIRV